MARKKRKKRKKNKGFFSFDSIDFSSSLPEKTQRYIWAIAFFLLAIIFIFSYFQKAGIAGEFLFAGFSFLIGKTVLVFPILFGLVGLSFFLAEYKEVLRPSFLAILATILGVSGMLERLSPGTRQGGWLGQILTWPLLKFFGVWVTQIVFAIAIIIGGVIFWHLLKQGSSQEDDDGEPKPSLIKKIFAPSFKVKTIEPATASLKESKEPEKKPEDLKPKKIKSIPLGVEYDLPPLDLLESTKGRPSAGNIKMNSVVIKKTLESFDIPVEMSEINIGPTVTQYSFKPAEGIKLSKITSLSNDLALALASHPIRIEAPIPGKSLVGVEVPNKVRAFVRLKGLISDSKFQNGPNLMLCFGSDVAGSPVYTNLAKMPHLLVAGSTGTGKTIFLNNLIISLLYKNSPDVLKFILIDPKRVEFIVYNELPHLLCPVIVDAQRATNALKWLTEEMDRRFRALARSKSKSIASYNEKAFENEDEPLPYIVVVIDELADLMSAKGREVESAIVRLAQMARAVGVHLIVATQRPSVEVITGLIKANITSRTTFQVASQIDSRTVLDTAGAEKLLGLGDMLFISANNIKPKRIQGAFVSEKEVKKITNWIKEKNDQYLTEAAGSEIEEVQDNLSQAMNQTDAGPVKDSPSLLEDSLYEEAKRVVVENKRASASLLQRKLRVGYARAARLMDMLEERKIIGPSRGAKPREVFLSEESQDYDDEIDSEDNDQWQKV
jgi:S-DNA-T family DNA segregation ATPase FtsK/SpoIIIE